MKIWTSIALALLIVQAAKAADDFVIVDTANYKGAIISAEFAAKDPMLSKMYHGYWTPTLEQIASAESGIAAFLASSTNKYALRESRKLGWFSRQYLGYIRNREKRILCNFLPGVAEDQDPFKDLKKSLIIVHDRGPNYWEITYRVSERQCERLHIDLGF